MSLGSSWMKSIQPSPFTRFLPGDPFLPSTALEFAVLSRKSRQVPSAFFSYVKPQAFPNARFLAASDSALNDLGFQFKSKSEIENMPESELNELTAIFSGNNVLIPETWAMNYSGFQFGMFAGQLGGEYFFLMKIFSPHLPLNRTALIT